VDNERFCVEQIDHVEFFVPDRYEAADWYERVLGLRVVGAFEHWAKDSGGPLMISPDGGNSKLALFEGTPQGTRPTSGYHLVAFRVGAQAFVDFLRRSREFDLRGPKGDALGPDSAVDHGQAFSAYFVDPYGHRLELTTYEYDGAAALLKGLT